MCAYLRHIHVQTFDTVYLFAIQILGATDKEVDESLVFEEILHRLPELRTLKVCWICSLRLNVVIPPLTT